MAKIDAPSQVRQSYIALFAIRRSFSTSRPSSSPSQYHYQGQPFTGSYETGLPTSGPLGQTPPFGAPRLTPRSLKQHLDQFVVGQERAKKKLCVAVYNHYQRVQEAQRRESEEEELLQRQVDADVGQRYPVEGAHSTSVVATYLKLMCDCI